MVLALALAAVAAAAVYMYANSAQEEGTPGAQPTIVAPTAVPMADVLVAARDIAAETTVTADMVIVKQVPVGDKNVRALTVSDEAVGKVTTVPLALGEQVLTTRLSEQVSTGLSESETFAYEVPVGKRAVSVTYDEVMGAGALIQPGDRVDVIALFADVSMGAAQQGTPGAPPKVVEVETINAVTYIVQDVEVLAVAQALTSGDAGVVDPNAAPTPTPVPADPNATVVAGAAPVVSGAAVARPEARSVTLAVSPEQAQRLLLASQTATLRLALRSPGDTTVNDLVPAADGVFGVGDAFDDINKPLIPTDLAITEAEFTRRALSVGEVLEFSVTLKNVSTQTVRTAEDAAPGFTYTEGTAYDTLGFVSDAGTYRLGLNVEGAYPTQFPYRWGLGRDVRPGESVEVTGSVKLMSATPSTQYWFGILLEGGEDLPVTITQDGMGAASVAVSPASAATVDARTAELRDEPSDTGVITKEVARGDRLTVLETRGEWVRVQTTDRVEGWIPMSAVTVVPADDASATPASQPEATPAGT